MIQKKSDIGSPVDLVDAIISWHMMARVAKKTQKKANSKTKQKQSGVQWFVFVSSLCCVTVSNVDWGSSLVTNRFIQEENY